MYKHATVLSLLLVASAFAGCVEVKYQPNPEFCANARGDETCAERFPDGSRPYCVVSDCLDDFYGCFPDVPGETCASPCGLENPECEAGGTTDGSSSGTGSSSDDSGTATGSGSTTGPAPCIANEDCTDPLAPFCEPEGGLCIGCNALEDGNVACAELDPANPVCEDGACVQCTAAVPDACEGMTPVCDEITNECVPCTAHDQCGEAACNLFTGACLPPDAVVHVGPGQMYATIDAAVNSFAMGAEGTIVIHGSGPFDDSVILNGDRTVAFLANPGDAPRWVLAGGGLPQLSVDGSTALLDGLRLSGNADDLGIVVDGGRAWVDRSRIIDNNGGGILAQASAELVLRNCFVGGSINVIGVEVVDASASVLYSTITTSTFAAAPAFGCTTPVTVDIRNSIIVSQGGTSPDELSCMAANVTSSATEADVGALVPTWFANFDTGDFHLTGSGAATFAGIAQWQAGDPPTDIDGNPRPSDDGTADHAGADVP